MGFAANNIPTLAANPQVLSCSQGTAIFNNQPVYIRASPLQQQQQQPIINMATQQVCKIWILKHTIIKVWGFQFPLPVMSRHVRQISHSILIRLAGIGTNLFLHSEYRTYRDISCFHVTAITRRRFHGSL